MTDIRQYLHEYLVREKRIAERGVSDFTKGLEVLDGQGGAKIGYRVEFFDGWPGERDGFVEGYGPLREVMQEAVQKYKATNSRNDVQAQCRVYAIFSGTKVKIPLLSSMWKADFEEFGK